MALDPVTCERARLARDARFDGRFFVGVATTGVYCRPVCPVRAPRAANVRFYPTAAAAEAAGFRPCRRCRPETAPGAPAWQGSSASVARALRLIESGALDRGSVAALAARVGVGERQLRRLFVRHLGAAPLAVARTRRAHFARRLVDETNLPMARVAEAAGFGSLRQFNQALRERFGESPRALRAKRRSAGAGAGRAQVNAPGRGAHGLRGPECKDWKAQPAGAELRLAFRTPFAWRGLLGFLAPRAIPGVEEVAAAAYRRVAGAGVQIEVVRRADKAELQLAVRGAPPARLIDFATRARRLFDLAADPARVDGDLRADPLLRRLVARRPGLRIPGAWDPFETAVRAILGQQVSVAAASTLAGRLAAAFGEPLLRGEAPPCQAAPGIGTLRRGGAGPARRAANGRAVRAGDSSPRKPRAAGGLHFCFPGPERLAEADAARIGLPRGRAAALRGFARAVCEGALRLDGARPWAESEAALRAIPGIGDWTAAVIALRALGAPDAFPAGDLGLRRALAEGGALPSPAAVLRRAEAWRPWRGYAAIHLWLSNATQRKRSTR